MPSVSPRFSDPVRRPWENQPRVPAGSGDGSQWTDGGRGDGKPSDRPILLASDYDIGKLVAEIPVPGGRRCVYRFDFGSVVVHGWVNAPCTPKVPSSGVVH